MGKGPNLATGTFLGCNLKLQTDPCEPHLRPLHLFIPFLPSFLSLSLSEPAQLLTQGFDLREAPSSLRTLWNARRSLIKRDEAPFDRRGARRTFPSAAASLSSLLHPGEPGLLLGFPGKAGRSRPLGWSGALVDL